MAGESYIEFRDFFAGTRLAVLTGATGSGSAARNGFTRLTTLRRVNAPGAIRLTLPADFPGLWSLPDKMQVVHWRRDPARGLDWYREHVGLYRDIQYERIGPERQVTLYCPGLLSILDWYHVLWPAGVANRTAFASAKAETVMKTLVTWNATSSATTGNGRDRTAPTYGVSVQTDGAAGNTVSWSANRSHTVLASLQALAMVAGGDFDLVYTTSTSRTFNWYTGQRGANKTALIRFSERLGNMDNVRFGRERSAERTAIIVAGNGLGSDRTKTERTGPNYHATTNNIEAFADARDLGDTDSANSRSARGDQKLDELRARDTFGFGVIQSDGAWYGPSGAGSYTLGDLVTATRPDGVSVTQQIYGVELDWGVDGKEVVSVEVRTP